MTLYNPTNSAQGFQFHHSLTNTCNFVGVFLNRNHSKGMLWPHCDFSSAFLQWLVTLNTFVSVMSRVYWYPLTWWEGDLTFVEFFPQTHTLNLIRRKTSEEPRLGDIQQVPGQYSRLSRSCKTRKDWQTVTDHRRPRDMETKCKRTLTTTTTKDEKKFKV